MKSSSSSSKYPAWVFFVICAVGFFCAGAYFMFISCDNSDKLIHRIVKTLPCLLLAIWVLIDRTPSLLNRFVAIALFCAAVGDWLLVGTDELSFLLGIGANLLAHIWYIIGFSHQFRSVKPLRAIIPLCFALLFFIFFLRPYVEGVLEIAVFIYSLMIGLMAWRASVAIGTSGGRRKYEILLLLGAILFMACDTMISLNRFVRPISSIGYWIMACYWSGQFLLAWASINLPKQKTVDKN